jgi:hypothetical protein
MYAMHIDPRQDEIYKMQECELGGGGGGDRIDNELDSWNCIGAGILP